MKIQITTYNYNIVFYLQYNINLIIQYMLVTLLITEEHIFGFRK